MRRMLRTNRTYIAIAAATALSAALALSIAPIAAHNGGHHVFGTQEVKFQPGPPTLPAGAQMAVLVGNPAEEGPFVMRLRFPAGYEIPAHRHPKEEHVTVISGAFGMAMGDKIDRSAADLMGPGSFIQIPTGEAHFGWTEEETVVQINAIGPFAIEYVDPQDDPRIN